MLVSEWLYGAIALLVGIHILTMLYAYRRRGGTSAGGMQTEAEPRSVTSSETHEPTQVNCPHCGVPNKRGYRFCRQCIADLDDKTPHRTPVEQQQAY